MTATERDLYHGLARTFRTLARGDLVIAGIARSKGDCQEAAARVRLARDRIREARRWDAVARMGQA